MNILQYVHKYFATLNLVASQGRGDVINVNQMFLNVLDVFYRHIFLNYKL